MSVSDTKARSTDDKESAAARKSTTPKPGDKPRSGVFYQIVAVRPNDREEKEVLLLELNRGFWRKQPWDLVTKTQSPSGFSELLIDYAEVRR